MLQKNNLMLVNRKVYEIENSPHQKMGPSSRCDGFNENILKRNLKLFELSKHLYDSPPKWSPDMGFNGLPKNMASYFTENPDEYKSALNIYQEMIDNKKNWQNYIDKYALIGAWNGANEILFNDLESKLKDTRQEFARDSMRGEPEVVDFRGIYRKKPITFKSKVHASELVKKITYTFGAVLVGITKLNSDWIYKGMLRGFPGYQGEYKVPHWRYAIVYAVPNECDSINVHPYYDSSYDAYTKNRQIGERLQRFLWELGYPARTNIPPLSYDILMPPVAIDAGLGQHCRIGIIITPELGPNIVLGAVLTNLEMNADKPIDFGVYEFCKKCKVCAAACPTGAISFSDLPDKNVRGYLHWQPNAERCFRHWCKVTQRSPRQCRICISVCPYTKMNNWSFKILHKFFVKNPRGLIGNGILSMKKYIQSSIILPQIKRTKDINSELQNWLRIDNWCNIDNTEQSQSIKQT